jgi:hypothetical protein
VFRTLLLASFLVLAGLVTVAWQVLTPDSSYHASAYAGSDSGKALAADGRRDHTQFCLDEDASVFVPCVLRGAEYRVLYLRVDHSSLEY